jgi:hypothetical protein
MSRFAREKDDSLSPEARAYSEAWDRFESASTLVEKVYARADLIRLARPMRTGGVHAPGRGAA